MTGANDRLQLTMGQCNHSLLSTLVLWVINSDDARVVPW
jgi:hypothetical protein